jgi:hypothetical protein
MDLASDGFGAEKFGADKLDETARNANGFTFPREPEGPPKEDTTAEDRTNRTATERATRPRPPARPTVSAAATLPPVPTIPAPPPIPAATSTDYDWFRPQAGSPAEHPLVRGLMLELPPRTDALDKAWLDQWLEAARAALELIYSRTDGPGPRQ